MAAGATWFLVSKACDRAPAVPLANAATAATAGGARRAGTGGGRSSPCPPGGEAGLLPPAARKWPAAPATRRPTPALARKPAPPAPAPAPAASGRGAATGAAGVDPFGVGGAPASLPRECVCVCVGVCVTVCLSVCEISAPAPMSSCSTRRSSAAPWWALCDCWRVIFEWSLTGIGLSSAAARRAM